MTERDKIINIVEQNKYCDVNTATNCEKCKYGKELENYKDMGCSSLKTADALILAGFGDVTKWKERAEKEKAEKNKWKCTANDWKQRFESREKQLGELRTTSCDVVMRKNKVISEQKAEIVRLTTERDEYEHRAEVAERALLLMASGECTFAPPEFYKEEAEQEVAEEEQIMANRCGEGKCEYFESIRRAANNNREYGYCKKYKQELHLYDWWWLKCDECTAEKEIAEEDKR